MTKPGTGHEKKLVKLLRKYNYSETAPSRKLIHGKFSPNPGVARCFSRCRLDRPQLLLKHHAVPGLELWHCPGCRRNVLIRIQRRNEND